MQAIVYIYLYSRIGVKYISCAFNRRWQTGYQIWSLEYRISSKISVTLMSTIYVNGRTHTYMVIQQNYWIFYV